MIHIQDPTRGSRDYLCGATSTNKATPTILVWDDPEACGECLGVLRGMGSRVGLRPMRDDVVVKRKAGAR